MKNSIFIFGIIFLSFSFNAQVDSLTFYKKLYPNQNFIVLNRSEKVTIKLVKKKPTIVTTFYDEYLILNDKGVANLTNDYIEFSSSFDKIENIEAYSISDVNGKKKKIQATNFQTIKGESESYIFHDDLMQTTFSYPSLVPGSKKVLKYDQISNRNDFPFGTGFVSNVPIIQNTYLVEYSPEVELLIKEFNFNSKITSSKEILKNGNHLLKWSSKIENYFKSFERAASPSYYLPYVYGQIASYKSDDNEVVLNKDLQSLYANYLKNIEEVINETPSDDLKNLVTNLVKDKQDELEKVKAIYYWVQDNIKYIAFEEGVEGFIPRLSNQVFIKRYGDCKDMACLIRSMGKIANIDITIGWIGSRDIPYKYSEIPSSIVDNHMIAAYRGADRWYFLDATSSFQPIDLPTTFILGKEILLYGGEKFELLTIPIPNKEKTNYWDNSEIWIEGRNVVGKSQVNIYGYYKVIMNESLKQTKEEDLKNVFNSAFVRGNNSFSVTNPKVLNTSNREDTLKANFDWKLTNYGNLVDNEFYINLVLQKEITKFEMEEDRDAPFEVDSYTNDTYSVLLNIPDGFTLHSMPENIDFSNDLVNFKVDYQVISKTQVKCTVYLNIKFLYLYKDRFQDWNTFAKIMKKAVNQNVVLKKK